MEYNFTAIEKKWQNYWLEHKTFRTERDQIKPTYYVLNMFPYPSASRFTRWTYRILHSDRYHESF